MIIENSYDFIIAAKAKSSCVAERVPELKVFCYDF